MAIDITPFVRPLLLNIEPYQSAREEFVNDGREMILLDANENPYSTTVNRYPDPMQVELKAQIASLKNVQPNQLYLSNGSDECISQLIMSCCEPNKESIMILPPTFGMYKVAARIHGVRVEEVPLTNTFQLDVNAIKKRIISDIKIIFIPTPNNPTGNCFSKDDILEIIHSFQGLVVIDEAYIEFTAGTSFVRFLDEFPNLVVLQTFSKAQGMAGARLGMAFAAPELIHFLNRIKAPYNINSLTIEAALCRLKEQHLVQKQVQLLLKERRMLEEELPKIKCVKKCYPSDANFLLVAFDDSALRYRQLLDKGIVVRNSSKNLSCKNTLRISVGLPDENQTLLTVLKNLK